MKKRFIAIALVLCLFIAVSLPFKKEAYADPYTAGQIASLGYAMMQGAGITFASQNATSSGMADFMTEQVESYVNSRGGTIADVFTGQMAVDAAGKLVVAHTLYNEVNGFIDWLKEKYTLSASDFSLTDGQYNGTFLPDNKEGSESITGVGIECSFNERHLIGWKNVVVFNGGARVSGGTTGTTICYTGNYAIGYDNSIVYVSVERVYGATGEKVSPVRFNVATAQNLSNGLKWNGTNYVEPAVLNPDKAWSGTIGGYSVPDTNLDQLLGNIDQAVADNNLVVEGEVIDIPVPTPTPAPIDPDIPLSDVPWEGLDNNLKQLYEQGLEEIGTIAEARDAITEAVGDQTGVLEDALSDNAGVVSGAIDQAVSDVGDLIGSQTGAIGQSIADNAGVVSDAIEQAVSDVQTAIGEQTAALDESLSATAEGIETIAEAIEDEAINWQKFDLKGLFPFCIPFDIYNMLNTLDASPTAPHVQIPFVIQSIGFSYLIDLDFSVFDPVATIMRQMELLCYGLALAWATSKVIKW